MDENIEILKYIYQNTSMGVKNLNNLLKMIQEKDNKIKKTVENSLEGYKKLEIETQKMLKKYKVDAKDNKLISDIGSFMGMKFELMNDNSDSRIADMLTKGFTMGLVDINKKIDNYKGDVDRYILKLANKVKEFCEENINLLKKYL